MHYKTNLIYKYFSQLSSLIKTILENKQIFPQLVLPPKLTFFRISELNKKFAIVEIGENY